MIKYVTPCRMKLIDKTAIEKFKIPALILMENAGLRASDIIFKQLKKTRIKKIAVICGIGNNGGDGFACARHLLNKGVNLHIFITGKVLKLSDEALINYNILKKLTKNISKINTKSDLCKMQKRLRNTGLIIDAIFGIGLKGEVREPQKTIINIINNSKQRVISLDTPSGLDVKTGKILGVCVKAYRTITFGFAKTGFIKNQGPARAGKIDVADISIPVTD